MWCSNVVTVWGDDGFLVTVIYSLDQWHVFLAISCSSICFSDSLSALRRCYECQSSLNSLSVTKLSFRTRPVNNSKCRSETSEQEKSGYLDACATNPRMNEIYFAILLCSRFCRHIIPLLLSFNASASWRSSAFWAPTSSIISLSIVLNNKTLANACLLSGGQGFQDFPCMAIIACDTTTQR